jgi:hypothetical protein
MIVLVVQNMGMTVLEIERQPPVAIDPDGPAALSLTLERVETKARDVHVFD